MQRGLVNLLARLGLAFAAIATATVLTMLLWRFHVAALPRIAPFFFLVAVLASSWKGGYTGGIASVFFAACINSLVTRRDLDLTQVDPYRVALLLLLSIAAGWIESHR